MRNLSKVLARTIMSLALLCTLMTAIHAGGGDKEINFIDNNLEDAKLRASAEGKMVFVDFYARWCTPCKWMDQTTFKDKQVVDILNQNFIAVKMNIDEAEGFHMKDKYEVEYLPTILIFNSNGKVIDRIEEPLTAANLINLLHSHNSSVNKRIITNAVNASPKDAQRTYEPIENDNFILSAAEYKAYSTSEKSVYRVQVGVYQDFASASKQVDKMREIFIEDVIVTNDYRGEKVLFKVMLGQFNSLSEAESFRKILDKDFGIDAIVF